jgi:KDO2-lipid IV(A) lauroyltransferase
VKAPGALARLRLAPDGRPRPGAPPGRGPLAARVLGLAIEAAVLAGSRLPAPVAHALAVTGGTAEWALRPGKRRRLAVHIGRAVGRPPGDPAVRRLVREELVNEARRSADLLWALGRREEFLARTPVLGLEHVHAALARGNGMILAGIHVGGWEVATAVPRHVVPVPTTAIVADDWLAWAIERMRAAAGLGVLYRSDSMLGAARLLRRGETVLVLGDDAGDGDARGYPVRFAGGVAELPAGMVALARLCGTPIVCFWVLPDGPRRWRVLLDPPVDPPPRGSGEAGEHETLQRLADRWTAMIRAHPEHWAANYRIRWVDGAERERQA